MRILILCDYRGHFWQRTDYKEQSMDAAFLAEELRTHGFAVTVTPFSDLDLSVDFEDTAVIYQSAQDPGLEYKGFIEDILLALEIRGAKLVPAFRYFRAHHNKVFMELLRKVMPSAVIARPASRVYGTYEDYERDLKMQALFTPCVFKLAAGAQGKAVCLLRTSQQLRNVVRRKTFSLNPYYWFVRHVKPLLPGLYPNYRPTSNHRQKFIVQEYVADLKGDFKVLVFGRKIYVLAREVRPGDFRASGSGRFTYPEDVPKQLLDYAWNVFRHFGVPFISLDVASRDGDFYLLEFQFVHFGCYTLERSPHWYEYHEDGWIKYEGKSVVEREFAAAIAAFLR